jgi:hypothetical protein
MSHPKNRRDRFLIGKNIGENRANHLFSYQDHFERPESIKFTALRLRDTTKRCGRACCTNPRHNGWGKSNSKLTMQEIKFIESIKKDYGG